MLIWKRKTGREIEKVHRLATHGGSHQGAQDCSLVWLEVSVWRVDKAGPRLGLLEQASDFESYISFFLSSNLL